MGIFSSGSKWKNAARNALKNAQRIEYYQRDLEFQRGLLSNIRQNRLARSQLELGNYSDSYTSSSSAGAMANINSPLAGEIEYSYSTSQRMQEIQDYQEQAQDYMEKYAKQQKKKATAFSIAGIALGAVTGGLGAGLAAGGMTAAGGAITGATMGQGIGQMFSNTGQFGQGLSNVISGAAQAYTLHNMSNKVGENNQQYELASIDPITGLEMTNTAVKVIYKPTAKNIYNYEEA